VNQGTCPNFLLFCCFHLKLTFEFLEEVGSALSEVNEYQIKGELSYHEHKVRPDDHGCNKVKDAFNMYQSEVWCLNK